MRFPTLVCCAVPALLVAGCSRPPPPAPAPVSAPSPATAEQVPQDWPSFSSAFIEARFKAEPEFAVQSGRHEFDGQMPDWSRTALDADAAWLKSQRELLGKFAASSLTPAQRFERKYLEWVIDSSLFWRAGARAPFRNPTWYLDRL